MKTLLENISSAPDGRYIAVDTASHSIAFCIGLKNGKSVVIEHVGKISLDSKVMADKIAVISSEVPLLCKEYNIDYAVIEQSIYIQNYQTSRILSYIIAATWTCCHISGAQVLDVPPMTWKSWIGYKKISKQEKEEAIKKMGKTKANKHLNSERKMRVKRIIDRKIPELSYQQDLDIIDSIGILLWAVENWNEGIKNRK